MGLNEEYFVTHTMRLTNATIVYRRTRNLRAVHLLLAQTKVEGSVRNSGIEIDDAVELGQKKERQIKQNVDQ